MQNRSRHFWRIVFIACAVAVMIPSACAIRFCHLNKTEQMIVGYWELIESNGVPNDRPFYVRFVSNRNIHFIDPKTGRESSSNSDRVYWFANSTDFWGFAPPKWKTLHRLPYDLIQLQKRRGEGGARIKVLEVSESTLVLHNISSENGPGKFRRRLPEEIQEAVVANLIGK